MTLAEVLPEQSETRTSERPIAQCPGLSSTERWDEASALRGEIHSAERLADHALDVARAHGTPSTRVTPGPLRARLAAGRSRIRAAYATLSAELRSGQREPLPAEEWLLDNSHVVEDQLREIQEDLPWGYLIELPRISSGAMRGYPRVYGLCIDYLRHTDARIDLATLSSYVLAYQRVAPLTIGELWAVPIMLRIGLILTVGALATPSAEAGERSRADKWAKRFIDKGSSPGRLSALLEQLESEGEPTAALLVQLLRLLRDHEGPAAVVLAWIRAQAAKMGVSPVELTRREHLRQAADQVSVGNAISSMRAIGAIDWNLFFARVSAVEAVLTRDPDGIYEAMDDRTRNRYRHAVEELARRSKADEATVARAALKHASAGEKDAETHIGYWLVDDGRCVLERELDYRPAIGERARRLLNRHPTSIYLGAAAIITTLGCALVAWAGHALLLPATVALLVFLFVLPASEMAIAVVNALLVFALPPRVLPKLALKTGVPDDSRTLIVVPALIDSAETVDRLVRDLEIRALANLDQNLHFALITDYMDADAKDIEPDAALLELAQLRIDELNQQYQIGTTKRFALFHRERRWNETQGRFLGWERKRGKLEELNRLLRGEAETSFIHVGFDRALLQSFRYVITLDADTELPREAARRLVATIAHPLNHAVLDEKERIVRGHAILQPRVGTIPTSGRKSRFARICAGPAGLDPYTTAVSDVYQDLYGEGSFVGKGIYDVDAFARSVEGHIPDDRLLSHDLLEGIFARSALVTDIEVLDEQPSAYEVAAGRSHRWIRGDWQLLPWLLGLVAGVSLRMRDRWKIIDNLRRSLLPIALVLLCFAGWLSHPTVAAWVTATLALMFVVPVVARLVLSFARTRSDKTPSFVGALGDELGQSGRQALIAAVFLLDQALVSADAIVRTLHRLVFSKKNLLEWKTMSESERASATKGLGLRGVIGVGIAIAGMIAVALRAPLSLSFAAPVLLFWMSAPLVASWLKQPPRRYKRSVGLEDRDKTELRLIARKTWHFFETFVTAGENFLPPDNFQEDPRGVVAHRTSPTNIGLYLLSVIAARDFGYLGLGEVSVRLKATLDTIDRLERRNGHVLNWYDTTSLVPLEPQYVSTVDSGNLAAYLWTVRQACHELGSASVISASALRATEDALRIAGATELADEAAALAMSTPDGFVAATRALAGFREMLAAMEDAPERIAPAWRERAQLGIDAILEESARLAPFVSLVDRLGPPFEETKKTLESFRSLDDVVRGATPIIEALDRTTDLPEAARLVAAELRTALCSAEKEAKITIDALRKIGDRAGALADGMDFRFLLDPERELFSIGYNASSARLDGSHYDLLASEARLATLIAIAKGDAPQEQWFRMGRPLAATTAGERVLLSWSGSMFEYLMPMLVTRAYPETLLTETYHAMLDRQLEYGRELGTPWGVSESAYNLMDMGLTYQYRAFGVPGLGLKSGLGEDHVVAPYATGLAALIRPDLAAQNYRALEREGASGPYGFYEAIDYTEAHLPPGRRSVVVKTFMAHHQGMTLVALDDALNDSPMQRRFHSDPRILATELLLEERVPVRTPILPVRSSAMPAPVVGEAELEAVEHIGLGAVGPTRVHLLGHGELSTLVTARGDGFTTWKGMDVLRFREDHTRAAGGTYIYVRDTEQNVVWSVGHRPTLKEPDFYDAAFSVDRVELRRRDGDIETVTEIVVSPEHPAELRRITLANHGSSPHKLDLTTYGEIVLTPRSADVAHPAFTSLFLEVEAIPERAAMLGRRRPRSASEAETWVVQMLLEGDGEWGEFSYEGSRARFIGRGRDLTDPCALDPGSSLSGTTGTTLDPVLALRREVVLPPGGRARLTLATALAPTRAAALELLETYGTPGTVPRTFELAWADARVELKHLGVGAAQAHRFQRLLSALLYPQAKLRDGSREPHHSRGKSALWAQGISGDLPTIVVRLDEGAFDELLSEVLLAHEYFRLNGMALDLVLVNEEPAGYMHPLHENVLAIIRSSPSERQLDQRGGVFLRRSHEMSDDDRATLLGFARVVLRASGGSLARQLRDLAVAAPSTKSPRLERDGKPRAPAPAPKSSEIAPANGVGAIADAGEAYVLTLDHETRTPAPWSNVLANPRFGTLVTETGGGFTWAENSQRHRITPWSNDPVVDPVGELLFLRDDADGSLFSLTPEPAGAGAVFTVRHAPGQTTFEHERGGLSVSLRLSVAEVDPVKMFRLRLTNRGTSERSLSLFGIFEWVLGQARETSRVSVVTDWDEKLGAFFAWNPLSNFPDNHTFVVATAAVKSVSGDRDEIFGTSSTRARPSGLRRKTLSGITGSGLDPCAAIQIPIRLEAGASIDLALSLGDASSVDEAHALARKYRELAAVDRSEKDSLSSVRKMLDHVQIETPDPALDAMMNHWLLHQVASCRFFGRSGFYQSGGAFGYRDQLQDVLALLHARPELAREHIVRSAARQFVEGDVQHWWHPENGQGVRTRCSDDMLWLTYATAIYVRVTGDTAILDESIPFLRGPMLKPEDEDVFSAPAITTEHAPLYEHCCRALDAGTTSGVHGLPLMRGGDWNDGMNRVGREGRGESVWLAWFLGTVAGDFSEIARARGDQERVKLCADLVSRIGTAIDESAWDGEWYRRATYDDGAPLGSHTNVECRIDAIAQSWSVIAGFGDPARARTAVESSLRELVREDHGLMRLLWPPFERRENDPGYIAAYPPGIRENGGQYTHGVLWTVQALTRLGEGDRAVKLLSLLNPLNHGRTKEEVARYAIEPYVLAGDVYDNPGHEGRGGWSWYTGSASWMYRIVLEDVLGVRRLGDTLELVPCIAHTWGGYVVRYQFGTSMFHLAFENPASIQQGMLAIELDGAPIEGHRIPLKDDGKRHDVRVTLKAATVAQQRTG